MAFSPVANAIVNGAANGATTAAINTTGATLIVIALNNYAPGAATVSDNKSNTWTSIHEVTVNTEHHRLYYCINPTVGTGHTFTASGTNSFSQVSVSAWSGSHASELVDKNNTNSASSAASLATGSVTPAEDNELLIAVVSGVISNTISVDGGFSILNQNLYSAGVHYGQSMAYLIQTSLAAANPSFSWTGAGSVVGGIATFKAAAGGGGSTLTTDATEFIGVTETFDRLASASRLVSEDFGLSDTFIRQADAYRVLSEDFGISDTFDRLANALRAITEDIGFADTFDRLANAYRIVSEDIGLSDTFDRLANAFRTLEEAFGIAETFDRQVAVQIAVEDAIGIADAALRQIDYQRLVTEDITQEDTFTRQVDYQRVITDIVGVLEAIIMALNGIVVTPPDEEEVDLGQLEIEEDLYTYILDCHLVTEIIGTRLYPMEIPMGAERPFIVYEMFTRDRDDSQDGETGLVRMTVRYDCQSNSYPEVRAMEEALRSRFANFYHREMGTSFVQSAEITDSMDSDTPPKEPDELPIYHAHIDLELWYEELAPV